MREYQIKNILVPTDFTDLSANALKTAIAVAQKHNAQITLLNCIEYAYFVVQPEGILAADQMITELSILNEENLKNIANEIHTTTKLIVHTKLSIGNPANEICSTAVKLQSDIIIMGTHGASGIREFVLGSNAFNVIKKTPCPVLTIPGTKNSISFTKILFPIRTIAGAIDKYEFIRKIIRKNNSNLRIFGLTNDGPDRNLKLLTDSVSDLQRLLDEDEVTSSTIYFIGPDIAIETLREADKIAADLIVVTAELDFKISEFFVGPFAQQIVNHSTCPVLTIRPELSNGALQKLELDSIHSAKVKAYDA